MAEKLGKAVLEISIDDKEYLDGLNEIDKSAKKTAASVSTLSKLFTFDFIVRYGRMALDVITGIGKALIELGDRGSTVSDIAGSFESLSLGVHSTAAEMLGGLRTATAGTIDDFTLMQMANKALGTGLIKSADEMATLAQGARMLSERSGKPLTETFEALTRAMVTGRTQGLVEFGFAAQKGVPIMAALRDQIAQTGPISDDFTDNVNQVKTALQNVENVSAVVTANALPRLAQQFRNVIPAGTDLQGVVGAAMNFIANATVNTAHVAVNAITGLVQAFQAGGTTVTSIAQQMWDVLTGKVGVKEAFANITALATGGLSAVRQGFVSAITPTLEWRDYLQGTGEAVRTVTTDYGNHTAAIQKYTTDVLLSRQQLSQAMQFFSQQDQLVQATADAAMLALLQQSLAAQAAARGAYEVETMMMATAAGLKTRAELEATAQKAIETYNRMKASGLYTAATLKTAWEAAEKAKQAAKEETVKYEMDQNQALVAGTTQILSVLGQKYKAAAIAGAIISTYQAVAKALSSAPWPANLVLAAGALAAGMANVAKIRSSKEGYAEGTPNFDFSNFGAVTSTNLHGKEAVIPQGGGHQLAGEIADAMPGGGGADLDRLADRIIAAPIQPVSAEITLDGRKVGDVFLRLSRTGAMRLHVNGLVTG